jgi:CDP-glucose 4,6-dehydratase
VDFGLDFYQGRRVLLTGHTGFKGTWLAKILLDAGAEVTGYALPAPTDPSLFALLGLAGQMDSVEGDVRDAAHLSQVFSRVQPEVVLHLAAQPLVRASYQEPVYTYETNVMGTVNVLECVRHTESVVSFLNVTTDKVYKNFEWERGYVEDDLLDGYDPYSNSKSCSELVTHSYRQSFFADGRVAVSTARAGNVIGGGDFAADRIVPDCVRAIQKREPLVVRNPHSTRPYEHALEPLFAYLMIAQRQTAEASFAGYYNVGPDDCDAVSTGTLVESFCSSWNAEASHQRGLDGAVLGPLTWIDRSDGGPHEANFLKLDCTKLKTTFGWQPRWHITEALAQTVEWTRTWLTGGDIAACMSAQIDEYLDR